MLIKSPVRTVLSAAGFLLVVINKVQATEETTESTNDGKIIGKVFEAVKSCLPLVLTIEPRGGPPSNLFRGTCSCSKRGDPNICPQLSYHTNDGDINLEQNVTRIGDQCVANAYLKANLTNSYLEKIIVKCKVRGFRSTLATVKVQKSGDHQPCLEDNDCRYIQQRCLRDYYADTKVCKCPYANDLFDPSSPDVCVQFLAETSAEQPGLISVVMIVIIAVLVTGIVLLGFRMLPTTRCCPGFVTGHNMDRRSDNTVPFRPMEPPSTQAQHINQEHVDSPPPPYNTLVFANPPAYSESQKVGTAQDPSNSGSTTTEAK